MYLSRLKLKQMEMLRFRIVDEYGLHKLVYRLFPDSLQRDFLYYVEPVGVLGEVKILIQSKVRPVYCGIGELETKDIPSEFYQWSKFFFKIRINPVVKVNGRVKRIDGRTNSAIDWLVRRADQIGVCFVNDSMDKISGGVIHMTKDYESKPIVISYADITGVLNVVDINKFLSAVSNGIGGHKGFGFGLLQLRPLKEDI